MRVKIIMMRLNTHACSAIYFSIKNLVDVQINIQNRKSDILIDGILIEISDLSILDIISMKHHNENDVEVIMVFQRSIEA